MQIFIYLEYILNISIHSIYGQKNFFVSKFVPRGTWFYGMWKVVYIYLFVYYKIVHEVQNTK